MRVSLGLGGGGDVWNFDVWNEDRGKGKECHWEGMEMKTVRGKGKGCHGGGDGTMKWRQWLSFMGKGKSAMGFGEGTQG